MIPVAVVVEKSTRSAAGKGIVCWNNEREDRSSKSLSFFMPWIFPQVKITLLINKCPEKIYTVIDSQATFKRRTT
jgi:hypothetical protein